MQLIQLAADTAATIPQPPVDDEMPKTAETIFNIFIFLPLLGMICFALREIKKHKNPVLLYCLIGGAFAATMEPVVDVLGLVYLKEADALGTFTILDRTMPLYICFVYPWYVGGLGYLAYRLFQNGITRKGLFQLWALDCVVDIALETPGIVTGTYLYYGEQPLNPWGFPIWWGFVNPVMPMVAGALIYHVRPHLKSNLQLLAIIPLIPMADGLANGAVAWPMWITLNQQDVSMWVTYIGCAATLGLALYAVWIISLAVARPETGNEGTIIDQLKTLLLPSAKAAPAAAASAGIEPGIEPEVDREMASR
ncbi:hypothetical protein [Sporichthya sp.]|uniref:hypothetical protein n=1 Tax=Sporichthya sp. TaxID=65475 RepID=UPI0017E2DD25|nr:hypothetical protein [Sporichthya sp.]MBA3743083.1 hypothetical protein [Sporichthya sp.]